MENPDKTDPAIVRAAARLRYETTPARLADVAAEFQVTGRTVANWSAADGGWQKISGRPEISAKAQEAADKIAEATIDVDDEDRQQVLAELRETAAIDERAAVLARHRKEWGVVRALAGEAVRDRDAAKAKLAVDVGRALDLAQRGEARAWGLDAGENPGGAVTVIIERG